MDAQATNNKRASNIPKTRGSVYSLIFRAGNPVVLGLDLTVDDSDSHE